MNWHAIKDPADPELDRLAERYGLHPLHIEDCRHRNQAAKIESEGGYLFVVLKPVEMEHSELKIGDLDVFLGGDFLITVEETQCGDVGKVIERMRAQPNQKRGDQVLHRIVDHMVDSYVPILDAINDRIDECEDGVLTDPKPSTLAGIFELRRALIELRRVLTATRDVASHLQRTETRLIRKDMIPFFRDVYDHAARNLDMLEMQRDLIGGAVELYLSSVANRTNQVMKTLTFLSTIALPALIITGIYGMNLKWLPLSGRPEAFWLVTAVVLGACALLVFILKKSRFI